MLEVECNLFGGIGDIRAGSLDYVGLGRLWASTVHAPFSIWSMLFHPHNVEQMESLRHALEILWNEWIEFPKRPQKCSSRWRIVPEQVTYVILFQKPASIVYIACHTITIWIHLNHQWICSWKGLKRLRLLLYCWLMKRKQCQLHVDGLKRGSTENERSRNCAIEMWQIGNGPHRWHSLGVIFRKTLVCFIFH